jgi:hypothetical protein
MHRAVGAIQSALPCFPRFFRFGHLYLNTLLPGLLANLLKSQNTSADLAFSR